MAFSQIQTAVMAGEINLIRRTLYADPWREPHDPKDPRTGSQGLVNKPDKVLLEYTVAGLI